VVKMVLHVGTGPATCRVAIESSPLKKKKKRKRPVEPTKIWNRHNIRKKAKKRLKRPWKASVAQLEGAEDLVFHGKSTSGKIKRRQ